LLFINGTFGIITITMKKRRYITYVLAMFIGLSVTGTMSSCKVKEGCEGAEQLKNSNIDRKTGELTTKRGSSGLFDKKRVAKSKKRRG